MATSSEVKKFHESHPWPDKCGISSLFRFYRIDLDRIEYLEHLFVERKLYHPVPTQFNDPFECKPHFSLPEDPKKIHEIRQYIIELARKKGRNRKEAKMLVSEVSNNLKNPDFVQTIISDSILKVFSRLRICSFTARKDNLLFWSHYADSHKGFCVEFDATKMPISFAFKVQYENKYPDVVYPSSNDATDLTPALVKSEVWEYEEEFRTILVPWADNQPVHDGESLILRGDEIKNVYLGANANESNKEQIIDLLKRGGFNPGIWTTSLSKSNFSLEFTQVH